MPSPTFGHCLGGMAEEEEGEERREEDWRLFRKEIDELCSGMGKFDGNKGGKEWPSFAVRQAVSLNRGISTFNWTTTGENNSEESENSSEVNTEEETNESSYSSDTDFTTPDMAAPPAVPQAIKDSYQGPIAVPLTCTPSDDAVYKKTTFECTVPLDYSDRNGHKITFTAELVWDKINNPDIKDFGWVRVCSRKKWLVFLCGGPGDRNPYDRNTTFIDSMLERGYCMLFPDYRGTGESSAIDALSLIARFPNEAERTTANLVQYLSMFRQDNIVRDLEALRQAIEDQEMPEDINIQWYLHGQSYGGWVAFTYLSFLPRSIRQVYLTAAVAPISRTPEEIYRRLFGRMTTANEKYYECYPGDVPIVREIYRVLADRGVEQRVPDGSNRSFSARTFLALGRQFIAGTTGFAKVHDFAARLMGHLQSEMEVDGNPPPIPDEILTEFGQIEGFKLHSRPLYGLLHEAIYCAWPGAVSRWAAERVGRQLAGYEWLRDDFDITSTAADKKLYFSGEMVFPWMSEDLRSQLLQQAFEGLAAKENWPHLYDHQALAENQVRVRAMAFEEDSAVDYEESIEALCAVGNSQEVKPGEVNWEHGSLRTRTTAVVEKLYGKDYRRLTYGG